MPGIVAGLTITFVSLVGYSAMAGAIGGGGLGDLGIRYGYQRYITEVMVAVVLILIVFVQPCRVSATGWSAASAIADTTAAQINQSNAKQLRVNMQRRNVLKGAIVALGVVVSAGASRRKSRSRSA
jgi:uncharacterized membrane protein